jgi:hypothetical protein
MAINPYKDTKTIKDYKTIKYTFAKESKAFQDWFKKTFPNKNYDDLYSEEKGRIRRLFETVERQAAKKILTTKKFAPFLKDLERFNKIGFYPRDYFQKNAKPLGFKSAASLYSRFSDQIQNIEPVDSKYFKVVEKFKNAPLEKKQKSGFKAQLLKDAGLTGNAKTIFANILKRLNIFEREIPPEGNKNRQQRQVRDQKITSQSVEAALGGARKNVSGIDVPGKKGSYIHLMHLADRPKSVPTTINELAYGPGELNTLLANKNTGAEKFRTTLSKHMDNVAKNYKGKEFYTIQSGKKSIDQQRFKEALELRFGKSTGKIPLKSYIDLILNEEARLMGISTDGLITMRPLDPITLKRMKPFANVRGMGTDIDTTVLDITKEKQSLGKGRFGAKTADLNLTANIAFSEVKNNLTAKQIQPIIDNIAKAMKGGLINQTYEDIMSLASKCTQLKTSGSFKFGGRVKLAKGGTPCSNVIQAVKDLPDQEFIGLSKNTPIADKILKTGKTVLNILGKGKTFAVTAGVGALGGALVKQFRNDDPTTYLTNDKQANAMLLDTADQLEREERMRAVGDAPELLDEANIAANLGVTAAAIPGSKKVFDARKKKGFGAVRAGLGPVGKSLSGFATPLGLAATTPLSVASQVYAGDSIEDIATNPLNYLGPAFADTLTRQATAGMPKGGMLNKALRLGMSPGAIRTVSRAFGLPGLALSLGYEGYDQYKKYTEGRGFVYNLLNKDE